MAYRNKSYSDKLLIGINRADLFRQGSCRNSDDSSRDELIFRGSYSDNAIPAISFEKQFEIGPFVAPVSRAMNPAEPHSPTSDVHTALEDDDAATENVFGVANESQLSLASQPSAVSTGKKRGRKSNWQPIEIVIALFCRVFAQTEHGSRSKDASRYLSAKTQYGLVARALRAFLDAPGSPGYAWPEDVDIELSIRERTQGQSDITGEVLYKKGNVLKSYLRQYTAKFATVYAAANDGKYIPPSGDNDGTIAWVTAEKTELSLERYPNARCLDGTPGVFYVNLAPERMKGSVNEGETRGGGDGEMDAADGYSTSRTWVVMLQGGGECVNAVDCSDRAGTARDRANSWPMRWCTIKEFRL